MNDEVEIVEEGEELDIYETLYNHVIDLVENRRFIELKPLLAALQPIDIADIIEEADEKDMPLIFRLLSKDLAADAFVELDPDNQELLIKTFSDLELKNILDELFVDDTVDMIEEMPASIVKRILKQSDPNTRKTINELLKYPEDSAGSIMTTEFVALKEDMTVDAAIDFIKKNGLDSETLYTCYVTDIKKKLLGCVTLRQILFADRSSMITSIMDDNVLSVGTLDDVEEVANKFKRYDFEVMPVVDKEERIVGIITVDDAVDVLVEEATEDIQLMNAIKPTDDTYFKTPIWKHWSNCITWLTLLMISGIFSGLVIDSFETMFAALPLLVGFIPRLMGAGGNAGSQTSAIIVRGLALEEIDPKDILKCVLKELGIGAMCGITLALVNVPVTWIMYGSELSANAVWSLSLAFGLSLFIVVLASKLLGCTLPILAKVCKLDPALMSSPIITTVIDISSVAIYFSIVKVLVMPILG